MSYNKRTQKIYNTSGQKNTTNSFAWVFLSRNYSFKLFSYLNRLWPDVAWVCICICFLSSFAGRSNKNRLFQCSRRFTNFSLPVFFLYSVLWTWAVRSVCFDWLDSINIVLFSHLIASTNSESVFELIKIPLIIKQGRHTAKSLMWRKQIYILNY